MKISDFFNEEVEIDDSGVKLTISRLERAAELFVKNNFTFEVTSWGSFAPADTEQNPWGVFGLTIEEALELIKYESFILGVQFAECHKEDDAESWFKHNIFDPLDAKIADIKQSRISDIHKMSSENADALRDIELRLIKELNKKINATVDISHMLEQGIRYVIPATLDLEEDHLKVYMRHGYINDISGMKRFDLKKVIDNL